MPYTIRTQLLLVLLFFKTKNIAKIVVSKIVVSRFLMCVILDLPYKNAKKLKLKQEKWIK